MGFKVLCVDDSEHVRNVLVRILSSADEVDEVLIASDGEEAVRMVKLSSPDVVTMDLKMPRMDGISALRRIRQFSRAPIIMLSSYTQEGAISAVVALEEGAFGVLPKPATGNPKDLIEMKNRILEIVGEACRSKLEKENAMKSGAERTERSFSPGKKEPVTPCNKISLSEEEIGRIRCVGIGSSMGGPKALARLVGFLDDSFPWPIVIVQHIPGYFTSFFTSSLNSKTSVRVKEAEKNETLQPGTIYIAPGECHLILKSKLNRLMFDFDSETGPVVGAMPSIDLFFESMVRAVGDKSVGILLSGMGNDGVAGLKKIKESGAITAVQDPMFSVSVGMPLNALRIGAADTTLKIADIPQFIYRHAKRTILIDK
ncbi:MAG: chemotaxis-specific protein-glutamate methyltransferase CheB [Candidatus Latescibacteria bacterium]|nr:chemotaxis-specific protein-glutamate methyltransferase CheB [bacterium]MBD3423480.1 chemotaxis-specific protein-glutamate methyltransferase CheB [Candidatus Latescibacterota bacterium]